jgi:hypothetical protein
MNGKGVALSPELLQAAARLHPELAKWISLATNASVNARSYSVSINPGSIAAGSEKAVVVTVKGIRADDIVLAQKPTRTTDVSVMQTIPAADQITVIFRNFGAASVTPPTETYTIFAMRA